MTDDERIDAGAAAYRGFLFSDVRGFTAFAERHGNAAAAAMVGRFLDIARTAISRHEGAEVKTEGDAIHAVFPSASSAVLCGLEIVDGAAELNAREPDRPLGLGVGVHAGEAVETAEGYIGRAVNIAARLCTAAKPGEVLVSSTVKGITQASINVGFIPKGQRRLKGIQDPILVYSVTRDTTARGPREVPRPVVLAAAGVGLAVVLGVAAFAGSRFLANPVANPSPTAAPVQRVVLGPLLIGTYRSLEFEPAVTFDIVEQGWTASRDQAEMLGLVHVGAPRGSVFFLRVQEVIANPCVEAGEGVQTGPSAADLLTQLENLEEHLTVSEPETVRVGGYTGQQVSIEVSDGVLAACGGLAGAEAALFGVAGEVWRVSPGERFMLMSVDVPDRPVTIVLSTDWTQAPSVQELESFLALGTQFVNSARF